MGPVDIPVTPIPVTDSIRETSNHDNIRLIELLGEDFSPEITVWFGDVPAVNTAYRLVYSIECNIVKPFKTSATRYYNYPSKLQQ